MNFPSGSYKCIVADPPWQYNSVRTGGSMKSGAASHYPTMSLQEICDLPVPSISSKHTVLFLWTTTPLLDYGLSVMHAWGFTYKTTLYWHKEGRKGLGYYFNGDVEPCLMGTRGTVKAFRTNKSNVIREKPRKHSQKPEAFWTLIEPVIQQFDLNPKIELFARETRDSWDCWGNQV